VARNPDLTVKEALDVSAKKIDEGSLKSQPEVEIAARNAIGKTYFGLGLYEESLAQHRRALEMARPDGEGTAAIVDEDMLAELLRRLGETLSTMGKIEEAEKVFGEAIEIGRRLHGDRSTEVGFCLNELAIIRKTLGDREGAEKLYRETLEITRVTPGPDSAEYCVTLNNLAILVSGRGDFDEAEKMMREVLETRRRVLGEDSPEVANSLNSLANVLQSKGDAKSAEAMLRDALALRRRVFGAEHPAVATNINDLGVMLDGLGRHDEAAELLTQSLEMRRKLLGPEHTETAVSMNNLAYALFNNHDYPGAIKMFSDALELIRKGFGPVHPYVSGVLWNLADVYEAMHDDEAFEKATREMLEVDTKIFGLESAKVCNDQVRVAMCLIRTERPAEAEGLLRQCVKVREKVLPPGTWTIYSARSLLGEALAAQKKFDEAEPLLVSACDDLQKNEVAPPIRKKEAIERVIRLYESWGVAAADKLSLAQPWRDQLAKLDEP
jgi:tetratricopeptide (TPR) repeat protein